MSAQPRPAVIKHDRHDVASLRLVRPDGAVGRMVSLDDNNLDGWPE